MTEKTDTKLLWRFATPDGEPFMAVATYTGATCWRLLEWREVTKRDGSTEAGWQPVEWYSTDMMAAVKHVEELMLRRYGGETDDVRVMISTIKAVGRSIEKAVREAEQLRLFGEEQ